MELRIVISEGQKGKLVASTGQKINQFETELEISERPVQVSKENNAKLN